MFSMISGGVIWLAYKQHCYEKLGAYKLENPCKMLALTNFVSFKYIVHNMYTML